MKYKSDTYDSDIAEMLHEKAMLEFQLGLLSEAQMRKYDKLCLTKKALKKKAAQGVAAPFESFGERKVAEALEATANIEHADLVTA